MSDVYAQSEHLLPQIVRDEEQGRLAGAIRGHMRARHLANGAQLGPSVALS